MSSARDFQQQNILPIQAVIAAGQTTSANFSLYGTTAAGLIVPAGMTGTSLSFKVSIDGINFAPLNYGDNTPVTINISSSLGATSLPPFVFFPWRFIQIVSNATEASQCILTIAPYSI